MSLCPWALTLHTGKHKIDTLCFLMVSLWSWTLDCGRLAGSSHSEDKGRGPWQFSCISSVHISSHLNGRYLAAAEFTKDKRLLPLTILTRTEHVLSYPFLPCKELFLFFFFSVGLQLWFTMQESMCSYILVHSACRIWIIMRTHTQKHTYMLGCFFFFWSWLI